MNEMSEFIKELMEKNEVEPIKIKQGIIAYRKYLWALKHIEDKVIKLKQYRQQVIDDINIGIEKQENNIQSIKKEIEDAMIQDPTVDSTKTGGRTLSLPDIATVSLSKIREKVVINDEEGLLKKLGQEFTKVKVSLDRTKAKKYILETRKIPENVEIKESRTLSIRFKK